MAEEPGKRDDKFEFTPEGESVEYISLGDARVLALRHAQENLEIYRPDYQNVRLVSELVSAVEEEDYYDIKLSFRPIGRFDGSPGLEQCIIAKTGTIEVRQLLEFPTPEESETGDRPPSASTPTPPVVPPRPPVASRSGSGRTGGLPKWLLFGGLGGIVIAVVAIVVAMAAGGGSRGDGGPVQVTAVVSDSETLVPPPDKPVPPSVVSST